MVRAAFPASPTRVFEERPSTRATCGWRLRAAWSGLGADSFDLLLLHNPDRIGYSSEAVWDGMAALREAGLTARSALLRARPTASPST